MKAKKMSHDDKKKMAKKMVTTMTKDGKKHTPASGAFMSPAWDERKKAVAGKVAKKNAGIKKAVDAKKKMQAKAKVKAKC